MCTMKQDYYFKQYCFLVTATKGQLEITATLNLLNKRTFLTAKPFQEQLIHYSDIFA